MFNINNRKTLTEVIAPPDGYRFERGVITTFSLDIEALFGVLLTLRGYDIGKYGTKYVEDTEDAKKLLPADDPFASIHSLSSIIGNNSLIVFCKQGIKGVKKTKILPLLDSIVSPVNVDNGRFHPKVWILKYKNENNDRKIKGDLYRFICMSRNLTASNYLEASFCVDGIYKKGARRKQNENLCAFFRKVINFTNKNIAARKKYEDFIKELGKVQFQVKHDFFYQTGSFGNKLRSVCNLSSKRKAVIVSPFMDATFIKWLFCDKVKNSSRSDIKEWDDFIIISRKDTLNSVFYDLKKSRNSRNLYERLLKSVKKKNIYIFKNEGDILDETSKATISSLHAKIYLFEDSNRSEMYLGSANATNRGWGGGNTEGIVRVNNQCSVKQFKEDFICKANGKKGRVLRGYLDYYSLPKKLQPTKLNIQNDEILGMIGKLRIKVIYDGKLKTVRVSILAVNALWLEKYNKIAINDDIKIGLFGRNKQVDFSSFLINREFVDYDVPIKDLSRFIEITINKTMYLFVADSNIDKYVKEREKAVFSEYRLSGDKFLEYIKYILMGWKAELGDKRDDESIKEIDEGKDGGGDRKITNKEPILSMEDILRKCDNEDIMNNIRSAMSRRKNNDKLQDEERERNIEFEEFWNNLVKIKYKKDKEVL